METLFIYLIKSSGLIALFYFVYYLLLRKETFFTSNRWFLLTGLITSAVLPMTVFTQIIWIETTPTNFNLAAIPIKTITEEINYQDNLPLIFAIIYGIGIIALFVKLTLDFYSLNSILKGKIIQRQADFKFIDVTENIAPFSFFSYIVYNSTSYSKAELENILEHEKVHSEQNHTLDVLISRLFCIVFWFNPFTWLYQKAIEQNLEFIADNEASKKISDKKAYQFTLLKITTHENRVAITNHFYQSLIKKRIVMLNKNQSNKRNSWKYAVVIPALIAFVLLFQIEVIAQEKAEKPKQEIETPVPPAPPIVPIPAPTLEKNTIIYINGKKVSQSEMDNLDPSDIKTMDVNKTTNKSTIKINTTNSIGISDDTQTFINGEKVNKNEFDELDQNTIKSVDVNKEDKTISIWLKNKLTDIPNDKEVMIGGVDITNLNLEKTDPTNLNNKQYTKKTNTLKIVTHKNSGIPDETDIYIDGIKSSRTELDKISPDLIERMDVNKSKTDKNVIKIIIKKK
jgi:hypothetical protein